MTASTRTMACPIGGLRLVGFGGGLDRQRWLLAHEARGLAGTTRFPLA